MSSKDSIQVLALEYLNGSNSKSFEKLYNRVTPGLRNHIWSHIYSTKDVDLLTELVQRTWEKIITKKHQYNTERGDFSTWVYAIGKNEALQEYNKHKMLISLDSLFEMENEESDCFTIIALNCAVNKEDYECTFKDLCVESEYNKDLRGLRIIILYEMKKLPSNYSDIIIDNLIWRMKYHELADKYDIPIGTVKSRIRASKALLRERLLERSVDISIL